jgi:hypothetical protein
MTHRSVGSYVHKIQFGRSLAPPVQRALLVGVLSGLKAGRQLAPDERRDLARMVREALQRTLALALSAVVAVVTLIHRLARRAG